MEGQGMATKKMGAEFEALTGRLEGRVSRSREYHETLINTMRSDHLKFQAEVRSTLTGIHTMQAPINDKVEASVNKGEMFFPTPNSQLGINGKTIGGRDWMGEKLVGGEGFSGGSSQSGGGNSGNWRYRKLGMPVFDGTDPDGWILRVERYFGFYRLNEEEMLEAVVITMEGDALRWFHGKISDTLLDAGQI